MFHSEENMENYAMGVAILALGAAVFGFLVLEKKAREKKGL